MFFPLIADFHSFDVIWIYFKTILSFLFFKDIFDNHSDNTGLFISPSGIYELDCATTKTDTAERSISIGRESLQVFFVLRALAYFQVPPLGGSHDEKLHSQ